MSGITAALVKELRERTGAGMMECKKALVEANGDIELAIDNMRKSGQAKAAKKAGRVAAEGIILAEVAADGKFGALVELNCETDFVAKDAGFIAFGKEVMAAVLADKVSGIEILKAKFEEQRTTLVAKIGENINIRRVSVLESEQLGTYLHGARIGVLVAAEGANEELIKHVAMHIAASKPEYVNPSDVPAEVVEREHQIQLDIAMQSGKPREIAEKMVSGRMNKFTGEISLTGQHFVMDPSKTVGDLLKENNAKVTNFIRYEVGEGIEKVEADFAAEVAAMSKQS
ncbi:translation elongation factor Ts [Photorhabdus khanii]|uniref:Elongation factor Ts n=1 Tax=Photorhabdus khanii subsp. guanajuatensis TaxID=2100166 RepID=A0A4V2X8E2_9GAMM|nr:translation elongation factor Ts [Photorhabdus khanii]TDB59485.1 elongation factor Ts [Photorhabdus khanii subsp. guanajuatensis]